jgi:hypothetical protein
MFLPFSPLEERLTSVGFIGQKALKVVVLTQSLFKFA